MGNVLVKEETLTQIADAIREKGGYSDKFKPAEMPEAILEISTHSGEDADPNKPVRFYGPYGDLVYSYTLDEIKEMESLPPLPKYSGMICQEWNWSLENIQAVAGEVEIGALAITDDGSTRIYVDLIAEALNPKLGFNQETANSVFVDWGDGSEFESSDVCGTDTIVSMEHHYQNPGQYIIRLIPDDDAVFTFVGDSNSSLILHKTTEYFYGNKVYANTIKKIETGMGITEFTSMCFNSETLEHVTIPSGILEYSLAFQGCKKIKTIIFPRNNMLFETSFLRYCTGLEKVIFSDAKVTFGAYFLGENCSLKELILPTNMVANYSNIFNGCKNLRRVVFPKSLTGLGGDLFDSCEMLIDVKLPENLESISSGMFSDCSSLEFIDIPETVTSMKSTAFYSCKSLKRIRIPEGVTKIPTNAFSYCYSLPEITIPAGVTEIGASAFSYCNGIENYYMLPTTPPTLVNTNAFLEIAETCKIHVPKGCLEAYQTAENWSTYADYMVEMEE